MWNRYVNAGSIDEVVEILANEGSRARIVAGATDLILELERGVQKGIDLLIDVSRIAGLDRITEDPSGWIHIGPLATHNACAASKLIQEKAFPLARAAWEVGSPQIRNRGTVAGNLITASPANDTITPLMALGAEVTLRSQTGERTVPLSEFYLGVRRTVLREDEMLVDIRFLAMRPNQKGTFIKFALRRAQAISLVNIGIVLTFDAEKIVQHAAITYGAVAPTIIHAKEAERYLIGRRLEDDTIQHAAALAMQATRPINDVRGSAGYRRVISKVIAQRGLRAIAQNCEKEGFPENPVLLDGNGMHAPAIVHAVWHDEDTPITTRINGKEITFASGQNKTLLRLLREEGHLIGTKEGCAEGECGACTIFLDGAAVMGCMVLAPRAHGAEIATIEGLSEDGSLHPVQQSFVDQGAVQCGYCTPGFVMSAVKLLEERPQPSEDEIKQAITGNLCRCTGYYKIIQAIELAAKERGE